jgi:hypothetical protein
MTEIFFPEAVLSLLNGNSANEMMVGNKTRFSRINYKDLLKNSSILILCVLGICDHRSSQFPFPSK